APCGVEWNYNYHHDALEGTAGPPSAVVAPAACYAATPEPEACSDVWFRYSPPSRKPAPKKHARRQPEGNASQVSFEAAAAKSGGSRRVVRPVDALQEIWKQRSPWMGCLGLNSCIAS
ncbi:hypothetical protein ZWY2020_057916, partial [Hordeum vulgare]